jgi:DNA-binding IclR family transcriptional regulator
MTGQSKIVKSAGRVFAILEYFAEIMRPANAVEIRAHLGLPASSASAILGSLVGLGYLHYDPRRRVYWPTIRVGFLGDWIQTGGPTRLLLEDLRRQTHQLVVLGARCRLNAQYIQVVRASHSRPVRSGTLAPLTRTAVGLVLMSKLADPDVSRLVTRINVAERPEQRIPVSQLIEQIHAVRENGFSFCYGQVTPEVGAVGMPLPSTHDQPPIVLAVSGSGQRFVEQRDDIIGAMRERIQRYGQELRESPVSLN